MPDSRLQVSDRPGRPRAGHGGGATHPPGRQRGDRVAQTGEHTDIGTGTSTAIAIAIATAAATPTATATATATS